MAMSVTSGSRFNFPLSDFIPEIGTGFDIIGGQPINAAAFAPPLLVDLSATPSVVHSSRYFSIYDASSLEDVAKFEVESSGGGWGAEEGMTASASARLKATATSFTVHFNGVSTSAQSTVKADMPLSDKARTVLDSGIAKFIESYGTHFVAGYIYGRLCRLSYNMKFQSVETQIAFKAKYDESATELEFSETTEASLKNTLTTSNTKCSIDVEASCRGFQTISPGSNFKDLATVKADFDKPPGDQDDPTPIAVILMPWYYLNEVSSEAGLALNDLQILTPLLNKWIYVSKTCQKFIDDRLFTGHTQLSALRAVKSEADAARSGLLQVLTKANKKGASLQVQQDAVGVTVEGTRFAYPEQMISDMNFALKNFVLSFLVGTSNGTVVGTVMTDLKGNPIAAVNDARGNSVNGHAGSYFTWSLVGNDEWEGTRGKQSNWRDLGWAGDDRNVARLVLDRDNGTVQCWFCRPGEYLSDNLHNEAISIRGKSTSQNCEDPTNRDRIMAKLGGLIVHVSPM
ncbi:hypothetical protein OIU35_15195 [Boseaceae bacterium BT-24-1]|nr:hypothetical protein [Boseaceae bacterium BT-24-1]